MTIAEMIVREIDKRGYKNKWVAEQVGIKEVTFSLKLKKDRFTAAELVRIGILFDLDLNMFKGSTTLEEAE
ncbi:hypothetical protein G7L40_02045 [Paenibacillus polymyxa]|uniref:HTH cro/C1-type domain-containing protein n=1 Tax=Paenibacillus polymyxa TaxID=1406 RepID=A0A378XV84_PAEPO|nr:hypothetical protein [Paenibacillus polymyxa]MCF2717904.1 hypothetical protein [Paenibacillus sp. UKAQ_18]MBE7897484.1 hypothetical protein [Paenibacillus polymyxa]MBG9766230.1 hypothetical protein [Paenibacillus polymyxa]MCC3257264.1 hypothetical protein [Paenibacillus polymyxa]QPK51614.1 hypothetical protein G7035_02040 [Paenibacillus polymyxa]